MIDLERLGWSGFFAQQIAGNDGGGAPGRVAADHGQ